VAAHITPLTIDNKANHSVVTHELIPLCPPLKVASQHGQFLVGLVKVVSSRTGLHFL
jgi:hypothetical protein